MKNMKPQAKKSKPAIETTTSKPVKSVSKPPIEAKQRVTKKPTKKAVTSDLLSVQPLISPANHHDDDSLSDGEDNELLVESELQAINEEQSHHEYQDTTQDMIIEEKDVMTSKLDPS